MNSPPIWRAFGNEYWPALYFIDAQGRIRGRHFGEGDYDKSEKLIRELLTEAGAVGLDHDFVSVDPNTHAQHNTHSACRVSSTMQCDDAMQ